jgi:hypothetical protein
VAERFLAAVRRGRDIAETLNDRGKQPALDRIVVDDEDVGGHCRAPMPFPIDRGRAGESDNRPVAAFPGAMIGPGS